MEKYSIVSYIKNEGRYYLRAMLHSIVNYADEIIIVDNGSTDNTIQVIDKYRTVKDYNIKLLEIPTNPEKISYAINEGIKQVTNEWIYIMAGDEVFLPNEIKKIPGMIDEMVALNKRIGMIQYLDFIKDFRHYHTKYTCWCTRLWKNECNFRYGGDYQGDIYMGYDDGVQTGGITTEKNLPETQVHRRPDIKFFHYARCKPKEVNQEKRRRYWSLRVSENEVEKNLKNDSFYTLDFKDKIEYYGGELPGCLDVLH